MQPEGTLAVGAPPAAVRGGRGWLSALAGTRSFSAHVALTTGTNIALAVLGVVSGALAARLFGPTGRGELAAIQIWPTLLAGIANLGLPQALTYFTAKDSQRAGRYLGSATTLALLASLPFVGAGLIFLPGVLGAQSAEVVAAARCYLLLLPVQAVLSTPHHALRGRSDFAAWNALRFGPVLGWLGVLGVGWWCGTADPAPYATAYLLVLALLALPIFFYVRRRVGGSVSSDIGLWPRMLRYGFPTVLSGVPQALNLRLDQMLMAAFLPAQTLGLYVVAVTWSSAVAQLPNALGTVLLPRTAAHRDTAEREAVFAHGARLAVLSAFVVAAGVALLTPLAIPLLFGAGFAAAIPVAYVLVAAAAVAAVNLVLEEGLRGLGRPGLVLWAEAVGLLSTAACLLLLLRPLGIMGAAIASVVGYGTVSAVLVSASVRCTEQSLATLLCPRAADIGDLRLGVARAVTRAWAKRAANGAGSEMP